MKMILLFFLSCSVGAVFTINFFIPHITDSFCLEGEKSFFFFLTTKELEFEIILTAVAAIKQ